MLAVRFGLIEILVGRDIATQAHQLFTRGPAHFPDLALQFLALVELREDQRILFGAIPVEGFERLAVVQFPDPPILSGQPVPDAGKALGQSLRSRRGLGLPAPLMGSPERLSRMLMTREHFGFLERQHGKALFGFALRIRNEGFELLPDVPRNLGLCGFHRLQSVRVAEPCFQLFGLHPGIAGERIDLATIVDGDKAAPVAFGQPEARVP